MIHCCFWWVHTDFQSEAVGAGCAPVMRLTCGSITKVMISFLDGEVTAADSSYQYGTVGGGEREIPLKMQHMVKLSSLCFSFCRTVVMDESSAECETVFVVEYCESEMFVVSNAMTHTEHVGCDVFCSSYWKKDVKF